MKNLVELRWGIVGGVISFPFGLVFADFMVGIDFWRALMTTEWAAFKSALFIFVAAGFAVGISVYRVFYPVAKLKEDEVESIF